MPRMSAQALADIGLLDTLWGPDDQAPSTTTPAGWRGALETTVQLTPNTPPSIFHQPPAEKGRLVTPSPITHGHLRSVPWQGQGSKGYEGDL